MDFFRAGQIFQGMAVFEVFVHVHLNWLRTVLGLEALPWRLRWSGWF
jgi:hypothetical protein